MTAEEKLLEYGCDGAVYLTEPSYDDALVGVTHDGRAVYDFDMMVECLVSCDDMTSDEAAEFIDYNVIRALPYMGDMAPIIMYQIV